MNRTVSGAKAVHGKDPQLLMEKITRERIYASRFWKEKCFALTAESIIDPAVELKWAGGCVGAHQKPTPFLCLLLKMLQLQPSEPIVRAYIDAEEHKYLRLLAAFYYRFVFPPAQVYPVLEALLSDFRKIRVQKRDGAFELKRMDELVWGMLRGERQFDLIMPRMTGRAVLESLGELESTREPLIELGEGEGEVEEAEDLVEEEEVNPMLDEIEQENALRAKLGLKPLQR